MFEIVYLLHQIDFYIMMYEYAAMVLDIYILALWRESNKIDSIKEFVLFDVKNLFDFINQINGIQSFRRWGPTNISNPSINKWFLLKAESCTEVKEINVCPGEYTGYLLKCRSVSWIWWYNRMQARKLSE